MFKRVSNFSFVSSQTQQRERFSSFSSIKDQDLPQPDQNIAILCFIKNFKTIKKMGAQILSVVERENLINLFTTIPSLNQLYRKRQDKFWQIFRKANMRYYQRNDQFIIDQTTTEVMILLKGSILSKSANTDKKQIIRPIYLFEKNSILTQNIICLNDENLFLIIDEKSYKKILFGILQNTKIETILKTIKFSPLLKHLSSNEAFNLTFIGELRYFNQNQIIVRQGSEFQDVLYLLVEGQFSICIDMDDDINEENLEALRYLYNGKMRKEVPLMQKTPFYSQSPTSKQKRKIFQIASLSPGEIFGFDELINKEKQLKYTLMTQDNIGVIFEMDIKKLKEGSLQFQDMIRFEDDQNLARYHKQQTSRRQEREQQLSTQFRQEINDKNQFLIRKKAQFINNNKQEEIYSQINTNTNYLRENFHLNSQQFEKKQFVNFDELNDFIDNKSIVFKKINQQDEKLRYKRKSLVEEFSEFDPYFTKRLKIKIFKETFSPYQNSIFYGIKNQSTKQNNVGIYLNKVRNTSCGDKSFILFNNFIKSSKRQQHKNQKAENGRPLSQNFRSNLSSQQKNNSSASSASSAVRNAKRKLKSSRRPRLEISSTLQTRPQTQQFQIHNEKLSQSLLI